MARFHVDPEKLADAVRQMQDFHTALVEAVAEADSLMARVDQTWDGEAASTGQDGYRRLHAGAEQMREALGQLKKFLGNAHKGYVSAISGNSQMWGVQ